MVSDWGKTDESSDKSAFFLLGIVVVLWGLNSVAIKYLTQFFPPLALAPIRLTLAAALLFPTVIYQYGWVKIPAAAWLPISGISLFCIFLHQIALTWGISATSGIHAVLILGLSPLFTTLLSALFLKEAFTGTKGVGILIGFCGLLFIVAGKAQGGASLWGDSVTCIATITFVIGSLFVKQATTYVSPLHVTAYSHVLAAVGLDILGLFSQAQWTYGKDVSFSVIAVLLFSSFFSTALGALLWNMSIQKVGASRASFFQNASPVVGVFASAFFLGEQLYLNHLYALLLVLLGVSFGAGLIKKPTWLS